MDTAVVSINGKLCRPPEAQVSVFDRGFLYGDSVFEVYRCYFGQPFGEKEHLLRLENSAHIVGISMPVSVSVLREEVHQVLDALNLQDVYVRVLITRGSGPLTYDPATASGPTRVIIAIPLLVPSPSIYTDGIAVAVMRASRPSEDPRAAGVKASNYLSNLLAIRDAKAQGADEALLVSSEGRLLEGTTSNVFIVKGGEIHTPMLQAGVLGGITRQTVFDIAKRKGIAIHERVMEPRELFSADEVFITSSIREVAPVVRVDGQTISTGKPGPITKRLISEYRDVVERACRH